MGVGRVYELAALPEETLVARLGVQGAFLHRLANGVDDRPVEGEGETKSLGREETYEEDLRDPARVRSEVLDLCRRVASRLRRHDVKGGTVTLKVKFSDFTLVTRAVSLGAPCDDGGELFHAVFPLIGTSGAWDRPVRLLGVSVSNLSSAATVPARAVQLSLFGGALPSLEAPHGRRKGKGTPPPAPPPPCDPPPPPSPEKAGKLNRAVDAIREKFGGQAILPGAVAERIALRKEGSRDGEGGGTGDRGGE
jgi:hypothetical protein